MRILLITDNHTPTGGAEHSFFELKRQLRSLPDVTVYSIGFGPAAAQGEDYQVFPALRSSLAKLLWRTLPHPRITRKLRKAIRQFKPDVIHLHNNKQYPIAVLHALRGYKVVHTVHDFGLICPGGLNIHRSLLPCATGWRRPCFWEHQVKHKRLTYLALLPGWWHQNYLLKRTVSTFTAPSPFLTDYLQRNQFEPAHCIAPFRDDKSPIPYTEAKRGHFLFAGHLGMHKGVHLLLEEFALACAKAPDLSLTIAGTGPEASRLKASAQRLGIADKVHFMGWQPNLDIFYAACQAVIFPSIGLESYGLVITEAMTRGRPVIGVNRGTSAWLIEHHHTGLLFDPLNAGDLANNLLYLHAHPELVEKMGAQGALTMQQRQTNESILKGTMAVYQRLFSQHSLTSSN